MLPVKSFWTTENAGLPNRPNQSVFVCRPDWKSSDEPKILTKFSDASQKSAVLTPLSSTLTSVKDCLISLCTLDAAVHSDVDPRQLDPPKRPSPLSISRFVSRYFGI
jgi:hypothetical protein